MTESKETAAVEETAAAGLSEQETVAVTLPGPSGPIPETTSGIIDYQEPRVPQRYLDLEEQLKAKEKDLADLADKNLQLLRKLAETRVTIKTAEGVESSLAATIESLEAKIAELTAPAAEEPDDPLTRDFVATTNKRTSGAIANARSNEPLFVLRGQDPLAGVLTRTWALLAESLGVDELKVQQARTLADELDAWPRKKRPD